MDLEDTSFLSAVQPFSTDPPDNTNLLTSTLQPDTIYTNGFVDTDCINSSVNTIDSLDTATDGYNTTFSDTICADSTCTDTGFLLEFEFDKDVEPPSHYSTQPYYSVHTPPVFNDIHAWELVDTVKFPITTNNYQYDTVHLSRLRDPYFLQKYTPSQYIWGHTHVRCFYKEPSFRHRSPSVIIARPLRANINNILIEKPPHTWLQKFSIRIRSARPKYWIRKRLQQDYDTTGFNCYTVTELHTDCSRGGWSEEESKPVRDQRIGHICFGDVTTYYSSEEHSFVHKDKSLHPNVRPKYLKSIIARRQSRNLYFRGPRPRINSTFVRHLPYSNWSIRYRTASVPNLWDQYELYLNCPWDYIADKPIEYLYEADPLSKRPRHIFPKPVIYPLPTHLFCVQTDYPEINKFYNRNGNNKIGIFEFDTKPWIHKASPLYTEEDLQDIRNWIYRELIKKWVHL